MLWILRIGFNAKILQIKKNPIFVIKCNTEHYICSLFSFLVGHLWLCPPGSESGFSRPTLKQIRINDTGFLVFLVSILIIFINYFWSYWHFCTMHIRKTRSIFHHFAKVGIVRHPLTRILSIKRSKSRFVSRYPYAISKNNL